MRKVVYNDCHGGFSLSKLAAMWLAGQGHEESVKFLAEGEPQESTFFCDTLTRHSSLLVKCVEVLGDRASGGFSSLKITEVEDLYRIEEYDGLESVVTPGMVRWISALRDPEERKEDL